MKLAIIRTSAEALNARVYNIQEIGLAKSIAPYGISTDIYFMKRGITCPEVRIFQEYPSQVRIIDYPIICTLLKNHCLIRPIGKYLRKENYDIIQLQDSCTSGTVQVCYELMTDKNPVILHQGVYDRPGFVKRSLQRGFEASFGMLLRKRVDTCLAKTDEAASYLRSIGFRSPVVTLLIGLDTDNVIVDDGAEPLSVKENLGIKPNELVLLCVGRLEKRRRTDFLVKLCERLNHKGIRCHLILIGDGDLKNWVSNYAVVSGMAKNVHLVGRIQQKDLHAYYRASDLFVLASDYEIYGMVFLEAITFGLPVITNRTPGSSSTIKHGLTGYILHSVEIDIWASVIESLHHNRKTLQIMSKNAKEDSVRYRWSSLGEKYAEFYRMVQKTSVQRNEES